MALASVIKPFVPPILVSLVRALRERSPNGRYHSLNGIDRHMHGLMPHRGGYFVEIGANDGITQSNTLFFERHLGWRGVLVEPALNNFLKCVENRAPRNSFHCGACVPFDYDDDVVWLTYANLMTLPHRLDIDIGDEQAFLGRATGTLDRSAGGVRFPARAVTLTHVLDQAEAPARMDFFSLDVEGAELSVLRGLDHDRYRFDYIVVESRGVERIDAHLAAHGYRLHSGITVHDYLFVDTRK